MNNIALLQPLPESKSRNVYLKITPRLPAVTISRSINYLYPADWTEAFWKDDRKSTLCALCRAGFCAGVSQEVKTQVLLSLDTPPELTFQDSSGVIADTDIIYSGLR